MDRDFKPRLTSTLVNADKTNEAKKPSTTKKVQQRCGANVKACSCGHTKELNPHSVSRPPLQDLDRNRLLETKKEARRSTSSTKTSNRVVESKNNQCTETKTSKVEVKKQTHRVVTYTTSKTNKSPLKASEFKHINDSDKVNFRRTLSPHFNPEDELFTDSEIHSITTSHLKSKSKATFSYLDASPIKPNPRTSMDTVIYSKVLPAKKVTLLRRKNEKRGRSNNSSMFGVDEHETTYLDDIINWLAKLEWKTTIRSDAWAKISIHRKSRIILVNWLMTVQKNYALPSEIFFNTIRLFDLLLVSKPIPTNMMQIVIVTIMWIVSKYDSSNCIKLSTLKTICGGACDEKKFLEMERTLLIFLRYDLSVPNLTTFISYYLKKLGLQDEGKFYCGALYILHCFTLTEVYPTSPLSFMAAGAVYLTIHILSPDKLELWALLKNSSIYYPSDRLEVMLKQMVKQIKSIQQPTYEYSQAFKNFSTTDKLQISVVIEKKLRSR